MTHKFGKQSLRALVVTNTLALLLSGPVASIGPAMAQQSPYQRPLVTQAPQPGAPSAAIPGDLAGYEQPWPREIVADGLRMMVYQPQVEAWDGDRLDLKAAVGIGVDSPNAYDRHFGAIWITARTEVDKDRRVVLLADVKVTRANFPTAPQYAPTVDQALDGQAGMVARVISLDQLQASLAIARQQMGREQAIDVGNDPPVILFSMNQAVLVTMDGDPVLRPVAPNLERVVNTNVLLLKESASGRFFLRVAGYWATAPGLQGPWSIAYQAQPVFDQIKQQASHQGGVDLLDDDDKPGPYGVLPDIFVSGVPAELLQTDGEPQYAPIQGTRLLYVQNTASDIFFDTADREFYVLVSGRWFHARGVNGPWAYVDSAQLPQDFRRIPEQHVKGAVLVSIAGTPQAEEAMIANSIPQTATIDREQATFDPYYDGNPQFAPVEGTPMRYAINAPVPIIMVDPTTFYAVENGVWFTAPSSNGPWIVAPSVPLVIYTIPPASPIYYATYVRVYSATPRYVYVGYTPGYYGTYVSRRGTVVYGSGYRYQPWVGQTYYARPATYGVGAGFAAGTFTGFALGLATAAIVGTPFWGPHWDGGRDGRDGRFATAPRSGSGTSRTNVTINTYTSNVYNNWGDRTVVRQANVQPVTAPTSLRERRQQIDRLRSDSQVSRERAAQTRQAPTASGVVPGTATATRNDVFVGPDGNPYRQGARGPERLDDRRNREAFDPNRRGAQQDRRTARPVPAAAPAVIAPATPAPVAAPTPRRDDNQRRATDNQRRLQEEQSKRRAAQPAPATQPVAPVATPAVKPAMTPAPSAAPTPRNDDSQRRAAAEKARQDQAAKAATERQRAEQARAAKATSDAQQDRARRGAEEKVRQDQVNRAAADRRRAEQGGAARAQAEQKRQQEDAAKKQAEQQRFQQQAKPPPAPQPQSERRQPQRPQPAQAKPQPAASPQPQAQPQDDKGRQQGGGKGHDKKSDDPTP